MKPVWPEATQFGYFSYKRPVDDFNMGQLWNNSWHARRAGLELRAWLRQVQRSSHSGMRYRDWVRTHLQVTKISGLWSFCPNVDSPDVVLPGRKSIRRMTNSTVRAYQGCFLVKFGFYCCHCWKRSSDLDNHIRDSERRVTVISPRLLSPLTNL